MDHPPAHAINLSADEWLNMAASLRAVPAASLVDVSERILALDVEYEDAAAQLVLDLHRALPRPLNNGVLLNALCQVMGRALAPVPAQDRCGMVMHYATFVLVTAAAHSTRLPRPRSH